MPLREQDRFGRKDTAAIAAQLRAVLLSQKSTLATAPWVHCGYLTLPHVRGLRPPVIDVAADVDNAFRLGPSLGFESTPIIVTTGVRSSRFASIVFWEALHALAVDGIWIDIDDGSQGSANGCDDYLQRQYFRDSLSITASESHGDVRVQTLRKRKPTAIAPHIDDCGWTFGILTSGPSPQAAAMANAILNLNLPAVEVIFCGPRPAGLPHDPRVTAIDLDRPEPRGWITRKKNLIADRARYDNLCLLHDRYVVTPEWAEALTGYGACYSFVTFPQVYYADTGNHFAQRYPDYQLLDQHGGIDAAMDSGVYDADRVFHPDYDDFSETAFCCGGLYIARRSLWNLVRQDEALFHCEWEDVSFGLDCQRRGLPHRVNPLVTAESTVAHPLLLTRLHTIGPRGAERGRVHVTAAQQQAARKTGSGFKPIIARDRETYYESIRERFNAMEWLTPEHRLPADFARPCTGLADVWSVVERHVNALPITSRDQIAQLAFFLSDVVYKWPAPQILSWIDRHERALKEAISLDRFSAVVGWGTGSAFVAHHRLIGRPLSFSIDSEPSQWGRTVDGVTVKPMSALGPLNGEQTAVIVFSCFYDEIAARIKAERPELSVIPYQAVTHNRRFQPLVDLIAYFTEVERYYPRLFTPARMELAA